MGDPLDFSPWKARGCISQHVREYPKQEIGLRGAADWLPWVSGKGGQASMDMDSTGSMRELLRRFLRRTSSEMQLLAVDSPITVSQCQVLLEIGRRRESTVGELAGCMGLDKSTLSRSVDALIEKGYAKREPFPNDRRYNRIFLSDVGREVNSSLDSAQDARIERALSAFSPEKRRELLRAFEFLVEAFEDLDPKAERSRSRAATRG